ncbi:MAG: hypothetical protein ACI4F2_05240 [Acutalibacteraceae bacterium]
MTNLDALDASAKDYFYSLPQLIQEQIIESSVTFSSKQELEKYYKLISNNNSVTE